jgi:hypothetical protein
MDLIQIGLEGVDWINLAQDREGSCEHDNGLWAALKAGNFLSS